ncbi:MAG: tetratricopeptide repeat protein, partial [Nitrospinae bacterium]|nr:tetratricopeptide repeat protein [Nitrospinota bacterium]
MFKKFIAASVFFMVLSAMAFSNPGFAQDIKKGGRLYEEKKYSEAYAEFERIYKADQKNFDTLNGMAWSMFMMGKIDGADNLFQDILRKSPFHIGAKQGNAAVIEKRYENFNKAWNQYYAGDFKGAISSFANLIEGKDPLLPGKELWRLHLGLGYSYYGNKGYSEAKGHFEKSNEKRENYDAYKGIGLVEFQMKNYKKALDAFNRSLIFNAKQYDVENQITWCYYREGETAKAIDGFKKQIAINPYLADPHYGLALSLDKKGDKKGALNEFYSVMSLLPGYLTNDEFFKTIEISPEYKSVYQDLGWALYFAGLNKEGFDIFERGLKKDRDNASLMRGACYTDYKLKKYDTAIEYCGKSLSINPNLPAVFETVYDQSGAYSLYSNARTTMAWAYFLKNDYQNAMKEFQGALKINPDWSDANSGLGWVLYTMKRYPDAEEQFNKAIKLDPKYLDAYSGLSAVSNAKLGKAGEGWRLYYLGLYDKAIENFNEEAKKKDITDEARQQVERGLGWSKLRLKNYDESEKHFRAIIAASNTDSDARLGLGYALYDKNNYSEAIKNLKEAVKVFHLDLDAEIVLGWSYFKTGSYGDSLIEFRRAVQINPNLSEPYRGVGFSLIKLGRTDEGKANLSSAINLYPQGVDNSELVSLMNEKKELNDLLITMAWAYYNYGQYENALRKAKG